VKFARWLRLVQILVTLTLIVVLIRPIDWFAFGQLFARLQWILVVVSAGVWACVHGINVARWRYLLQSPHMPYRSLLIDYGAGLFANNFLPTGIGGDAVRAGLLGREVSLARAVFSVGLDRSIGLASYSAIVLIGVGLGLPPGLEVNHAGSIETGLVMGSLIVVVVAGLLGSVVVNRTPQLRARVSEWRIRFNTYSHTTNWPALIGGAYGLSVVANMGIVVGDWLIIQAIGLDVPFHAAIWVFLISSLSLLLPITVNGLGLLESSFVVVLSRYGISTTTALGVALLNRSLLIAFSLLGGVLSLKWKPHNANGVSA
jgi:uncharacterized membrane protein YbhN (UPF0104 family)